MTNEKQHSLTQYKEKLLEITEGIELKKVNFSKMPQDKIDEIDEILSNMDMKKI